MANEDTSEFERCWPWLEASLNEFFPTHTQAQVWERIRTGHAFLWPSENCAALVQIITYPIGVRALHYWLQGGDDLKELQGLHPIIERWAKAQGCVIATGLGRDGWSRGENWKKGPSTRMKRLDE